MDLAFRVSGIVDAITQVRGADGRLRAIQDGDPVRKGQVLARLRQAEYRDQVSDADATLRQAEADYERASQLYENRSISKAEYDAAYARYTASQARRSQAAISLGDATLRAPLDGVILRRSVEVGSLAGPSAAAFSLADTRVVKVVFGVPDVVVAGLKLGQTLPIQAEALPGAALEGRITRISPSADPNSRVVRGRGRPAQPPGPAQGGHARHPAARQRRPEHGDPRAARRRRAAGGRHRRLRRLRGRGLVAARGASSAACGSAR